MGIINAFPGGGKDSLNTLFKRDGDSDFSGISPIVNVNSPPTMFNLVMPNGVRLITSTSADYKGVWAWDKERGMRQILTADSGIYGLTSAGDVEGGALLASGKNASSATIYYYNMAAETITPIITGLTKGTNIVSIMPTHEGDGYWVILSYSYYDNGSDYSGSQLKHLSWPGKVFTNKASWDTASRNKILAAPPGGCMIQRTCDGLAYVYVYDNATGAFSSGSTGISEGNWTLRGSGNGIYYVSISSAYMYAYNWTTKAWISGVQISTTGTPQTLAELPGKTIFIDKAIYSMDWETGVCTQIYSRSDISSFVYYRIDDDNYLLWAEFADNNGMWRYTISTGNVVQLNGVVGISANPTPWRGGLLFTEGALAYYDITAGTLTVYDASCSAGAFVNSHTVAAASGSYLKIYDLDAAVPLIQTSAAISKASIMGVAAYGDTVLLSDSYHYVYGYSISTNAPFLLDRSCATGSHSGGTVVGGNGKLYAQDFNRNNGGYLYDVRTLQKVFFWDYSIRKML